MRKWALLLACSALLALLGAAGLGDRIARAAGAPPGAEHSDRHIVVDQFGYRPDDPKVAVIRNPKTGYDASDSFAPGEKYEVRRVADGQVVFSGKPVAWRHGRVEDSSGDQGWWFDFSAVHAPGRYQVIDVERGVRSPEFDIDVHVYQRVLRAAVRMFFYQRAGFAKRAPFAADCWTDEAAYLGPGQDGEAHDVNDRENPAKVRDVSGGWFDAADTNKYVTFAVQPVHQLLYAYQENPAAFGDDFGIPESGNGIPDVLDEVKWEIDWLKKMQFSDGSVALKVGEIVYAGASPPSHDKTPRYYIPPCSSATIAAAGMFAHAAYVFRDHPALASEAKDLQARALRAWWRFFEAAPQVKCDFGVVKSGIADLSAEDQYALAAEAAVYLFAITGETGFSDYVQSHYRQTWAYREPGWERYNAHEGKALLLYGKLAGANAAAAAAIRSDFRNEVQSGRGVFGFEPDDDLYRAFLHDAQYHWGSATPRANYGSANLDALRYGAAERDADRYRQRALEILHYFHGVNPIGIVYLSNMYSLGATRSVNRLFHAWFAKGTRWGDAQASECGPAPGYVPGGPNAFAERSGVPASIAPPAGQPAQKSYRDWNEGWPESSWVVNEPGIYYQAAYVELLAEFAH